MQRSHTNHNDMSLSICYATLNIDIAGKHVVKLINRQWITEMGIQVYHY